MITVYKVAPSGTNLVNGKLKQGGITVKIGATYRRTLSANADIQITPVTLGGAIDLGHNTVSFTLDSTTPDVPVNLTFNAHGHTCVQIIGTVSDDSSSGVAPGYKIVLPFGVVP